MDEGFPLAQWFDVTKPITKAMRKDAEEQMSVYAVKDGDAPQGKRWRAACKALRQAIKAHNACFPVAG
jgi:hypothetical protein